MIAHTRSGVPTLSRVSSGPKRPTATVRHFVRLAAGLVGPWRTSPILKADNYVKDSIRVPERT